MSRLLVAAMASIAACSSAPAAPDAPLPDWPACLPERAYFERAWEADPANAARQPLPEYLGHVASFYAGSILAPGWPRASRGLLRDASAADRAVLEPKLACLGQLAAAEWAKGNAGRRLSSQTLMAWSRALDRARHDGRLHD